MWKVPEPGVILQNSGCTRGWGNSAARLTDEPTKSTSSLLTWKEITHTRYLFAIQPLKSAAIHFFWKLIFISEYNTIALRAYVLFTYISVWKHWVLIYHQFLMWFHTLTAALLSAAGCSPRSFRTDTSARARGSGWGTTRWTGRPEETAPSAATHSPGTAWRLEIPPSGRRPTGRTWGRHAETSVWDRETVSEMTIWRISYTPWNTPVCKLVSEGDPVFLDQHLGEQEERKICFGEEKLCWILNTTCCTRPVYVPIFPPYSI